MSVYYCKVNVLCEATCVGNNIKSHNTINNHYPIYSTQHWDGAEGSFNVQICYSVRVAPPPPFKTSVYGIVIVDQSLSGVVVPMTILQYNVFST